jgi:flagellar motor switch protein FliN/FliY
LEAQQGLLAESWNQCFDTTVQLKPRGLEPVAAESVPESLQEPGLVTWFEESGTVAAVLVPASCGLPEWYAAPNDSQKSRLDTLAMEWSLNLWPEDHAVEKSGTLAVPSLAEHLTSRQMGDGTALIPLELLDLAGGVLGTLYLVWPLKTLDEGAPPQDPATEPAAVPKSSVESAASPPAARSEPPTPRGPDPLARLRKVPVAISVRLAEKKIPLSQLLALTPGSLVTFNKSCDGLLDLYVNNSLYCRGEAVKIGESFGLKIDHVGVQVERESKLLQG